MSILIKGMEMPKYGCDHCFLRTGNYCGRIEKDESVVEYARKNERHPDCPLVPVPTPHGRLIEAERLKEVFHRNVVSGDAFDQLIDIAPTIIPAEGGVK